MCGIKNSKCKDKDPPEEDLPTSSPTMLIDRLEENSMTSPFLFADMINGKWSVDRNFIYELNPVINCPLNGTVIFKYPNTYHDVVKMASAEHYDNCDFTDSIELSPVSPALADDEERKYDYMTYYHQCSTPGALEYISCSVPGHCLAGQKIAIQTSTSVDVYNEDGSSMVMHVDRISRVLTAMGYSIQADTGFVEMPFGYQTEENAEKTMEWIWCGILHCPDFYDFQADGLDDTEKERDCIGSSNLLLGFIERNKPTPDFEKSEEYYNKAIEVGGTNECAARSYKSKMFLDKGDYEKAVLTAEELCDVCGVGGANDVYGTAVRQAKSEFLVMDSDIVAWPCKEPDNSAATSQASGLISLAFLFLRFIL